MNIAITKEQSNFIKLIAILTMLIDHMGIILFPDVIALRIIGRIAFPLFAYQIVVGYLNTRNIKKYILRLLTLGVVCQIPYYYAMNNFDPYNAQNFITGLSTFFTITNKTLNILFTLSLGLICIYLIEKKHYIVLTFMLTILSILSFYEMDIVDYGIYGVFTIILMYTYVNNFKLLFISFFILNIVLAFSGIQSLYQIFSIMAMIFLIKPINLKFKIPGWFFYLFYPMHLSILYGIKIWLEARG
ncbi:MAG TPA: hypothetical protein DEP72_01265 [Clostridiales bacterium]|nr:MAG: hypothetical protein A2Y18_05720 [Clostridiales bacterium GWD2_32_19]HCC06782.1 hypothetical protein [Clostridiales bacterium]